MKCQSIKLLELKKGNPKLCLSAMRQLTGCHRCDLYSRVISIKVKEGDGYYNKPTDIKKLEKAGYKQVIDSMVKIVYCNSRIMNPRYEKIMEEKRKLNEQYHSEHDRLNEEIEAL